MKMKIVVAAILSALGFEFMGASSADPRVEQIKLARTMNYDGSWNRTAAVLSTITQALSRKENGEEFTVVQRNRLGLAPGERGDLSRFVTKGGAKPLCGKEDGIDEWNALKCREYDVVTSSQGYCGNDRECITIRLAPLVEGDPKRMQVIKEGLAHPKQVLPDPLALEKQLQLTNVQEPGLIQPPFMSWFWTYSDTNTPLTATLTKEVDKDLKEPATVYVIRWKW